MSKLQGSCLCEKIKFEIDGEPDVRMQITCHCRDCQHITGAGHARSMGVPLDTVTWNAEPKSYAIQHEKSIVDTAFCPDCGSPLYKRTSMLPHLIFFHVGALDPECSATWRPHHTSFPENKPAWDTLE